MWMRGLEGAVRVRCPHCFEADWRTRIELDGCRPFTCFMCFWRGDKPLPARGLMEGCTTRLAHMTDAVRGLFRRSDREDEAPV